VTCRSPRRPTWGLGRRSAMSRRHSSLRCNPNAYAVSTTGALGSAPRPCAPRPRSSRPARQCGRRTPQARCRSTTGAPDAPGGRSGARRCSTRDTTGTGPDRTGRGRPAATHGGRRSRSRRASATTGDSPGSSTVSTGPAPVRQGDREVLHVPRTHIRGWHSASSANRRTDRTRSVTVLSPSPWRISRA
jgi:hypothetical protein